MKKREKILIGTTNPGKVRELGQLFGGLPIDLVGLNDIGISTEVDESGSTFSENARLKAVGYARLSGLRTLGDDSGLEVKALGDRPGVLSARYGGENIVFDDRIRLLLRELSEIPDADRSARFVCVMSLADRDGRILIDAEGVCTGQIAQEPRGAGGFGYDPVFIPADHCLTFAELQADIKQQISHRARAAAKIIRYLQGFLIV